MLQRDTQNKTIQNGITRFVNLKSLDVYDTTLHITEKNIRRSYRLQKMLYEMLQCDTQTKAIRNGITRTVSIKRYDVYETIRLEPIPLETK